jgi:hypothetical protein
MSDDRVAAVLLFPPNFSFICIHTFLALFY